MACGVRLWLCAQVLCFLPVVKQWHKAATLASRVWSGLCLRELVCFTDGFKGDCICESDGHPWKPKGVLLLVWLKPALATFPKPNLKILEESLGKLTEQVYKRSLGLVSDRTSELPRQRLAIIMWQLQHEMASDRLGLPNEGSLDWHVNNIMTRSQELTCCCWPGLPVLVRWPPIVFCENGPCCGAQANSRVRICLGLESGCGLVLMPWAEVF